VDGWVRRIEVSFSLTLGPGEQRTLMYFLAQRPDRATASTRGGLLRALALVGLSDDERAQIASFALPAP